MKPGDLVELGYPGKEALVVGVVVGVCLPEDHRNGMQLIQALHERKITWWPVGYVRKISKERE